MNKSQSNSNYYNKNREKILSHAKEYYSLNRERVLEYKKERYSNKTYKYQAILTSDVSSSVEFPSLREANFTLDVDSYRIGSSDYYNYNQILNYTSSQFQNLLTFISSSNPTINVDYNDYENFIHFGSATQQLETFQYKLS
jgi:hypothetical protein